MKQEVLLEGGYFCANPVCRHVLTLEVHHIVAVKDCGGNDPANLLALCPNCHARFHRRHIPPEAIRHWKGMQVALNEAVGRQSVDLLLFLRKYADIWYSGDGVLPFARLIARGLVEIDATDFSFMAPNEGRLFRSSGHRLKLTDEGALLVEAWVAGDEIKFRRLVGAPNGANSTNESESRLSHDHATLDVLTSNAQAD